MPRIHTFQHLRCPWIPRKPLRILHRSFTNFTATEDALHVPSLSASFPYRWLRDSCQCPSCVHPSTSQKLHRSSDIPHDIRPLGVNALSGDVVSNQKVGAKPERNPNGLRVEWPPSKSTYRTNSGNEQNHISFYTESFLRNHTSSSSLAQFHHDKPLVPWTSSDFSSGLASPIPYSSLDSPSYLFKVLDQLVRYGLVFISGMSTQQTSDQSCELRVLANRLGLLRNTFYRDVWDVRSVKNSKNIAYTNLDLGFHMDLMYVGQTRSPMIFSLMFPSRYFEEPPRYQILHCLRNRVEGGSSIFVDGLHAALTLSRSNPAHFAALATNPVHFHYINDGHHLHHAHNTFELRPCVEGEDTTNSVFVGIKYHKFVSINYSPPFQAPLPVNTPAAVYDALQDYASILEDPHNRFEYLLREGDVVLFDNRRVLHGRREFVDKSEVEGKGEETNRWLKGCYLEEDAVLDKRRVTANKIGK